MMYAIGNQSIDINLGDLTDLKNISKDYILLNEDRILNFVKDIDGFVDLINHSLSIFKKYFPNAKYYLALEEDYECSSLDHIVAYIINGDASFEENCHLDELLSEDFVKLSDDFPKAWLKFNYDIEEDDEYYELWRKGIIDNY